jgi:hypothetical protein
MKYIFYLFLSPALLCLGCRSQRPHLETIKVTEAYPIIQPKGNVTGYDTASVTIYYYKDLKLYHLEYGFDSVANGVLLKSETRRHYLLHREGDSVGYDFDDHKSLQKIKVPMDSVYKLEWIFNTNLQLHFNNNFSELISSQGSRESGILKEEYSFRDKEDSSKTGIASFEYSGKLKDIKFSLSPQLDSLKKMKLVKLRGFTNARYFEKERIHVDKLEVTYLLERVKPGNEKMIMEIFKEIDGN